MPKITICGSPLDLREAENRLRELGIEPIHTASGLEFQLDSSEIAKPKLYCPAGSKSPINISTFDGLGLKIDFCD